MNIFKYILYGPTVSNKEIDEAIRDSPRGVTFSRLAQYLSRKFGGE